MSLKIGRNDPCWCGSGRKYKKCHLAADEAGAHTRAAAELAAARPAASHWQPPDDLPLPVLPPAAARPAPEPVEEDPENLAFWKAFDEAGYEGRVRIFVEEIARGTDAARLFDMLDTLHQDTQKHGDRALFLDLAQRARAQAPEAYAEDLIWYHSWMIEDAVAERAYDRLPALVAPLADVAAASIDEFYRIMDMLLFHDQVAPLIDAMARAWPSVSASRKITPYAIAQFAARLTMLQVFAHLARGGAPDAADPGLQAALEPLGAVDQRRLQGTLDALSGRVGHTWTVDDFKHEHDHRDDLEASAEDAPEEETADDSWAQDECARLAENLHTLSLEWAVALRHERGVPLARTEIVRELLVEYLLDRPPARDLHAPLLPERRGIEQRLVTLLSPLSSLYYQGGVFFALLPAFIDFLQDCGLARRDAARRARADILALRPQVLQIVEGGTTDPALHEAVRVAGGG